MTPQQPIVSPRPTWEAPEDLPCFELVEDYAILACGIVWSVPHGYQFPGAHLPRALWTALTYPADPLIMAASLVHDFNYFTHWQTRDLTDQAFREILLSCGIPPIQARLMYEAVVEWGASYWTNTKEDAAYLELIRTRLIAEGADISPFGFPELSGIAEQLNM